MSQEFSARDRVFAFIEAVDEAAFLWMNNHWETLPGQTPLEDEAIRRQCESHTADAIAVLVRLKIAGLPDNLFDAATKAALQWDRLNSAGGGEVSDLQQDVSKALLKWAENPVKENHVEVGSEIHLAGECPEEDRARNDRRKKQQEADQKAPLSGLAIEFCTVVDDVVNLAANPAREADRRGMTMETFEAVALKLLSRNRCRAICILQVFRWRGMPDPLARLCESMIADDPIDRVLWAEAKPRALRWGLEASESAPPQWILASVLAARMETDKSGLLRAIKRTGCTTRNAQHQKNALEVLAADVPKLAELSPFWNDRVEYFNSKNLKA